ncbi:hypothetical protein DIPPA_24496 [Diplonema papillatum]|nr:hypothetical protein DIPPA_24496 [Diplonema papillatum]
MPAAKRKRDETTEDESNSADAATEKRPKKKDKKQKKPKRRPDDSSSEEGETRRKPPHRPKGKAVDARTSNKGGYKCEACGKLARVEAPAGEDEFWISKQGTLVCNCKPTTKEDKLTAAKGPFTCQHPGCGKLFSFKSNMKRHHAAVHKKDASAPEPLEGADPAGKAKKPAPPKIHACAQCDKSYATKNALRDHERVKHSDAPSLFCPGCGWSTKVKWKLRRHLNSSSACSLHASTQPSADPPTTTQTDPPSTTQTDPSSTTQTDPSSTTQTDPPTGSSPKTRNKLPQHPTFTISVEPPESCACGWWGLSSFAAAVHSMTCTKCLVGSLKSKGVVCPSPSMRPASVLLPPHVPLFTGTRNTPINEREKAEIAANDRLAPMPPPPKSSGLFTPMLAAKNAEQQLSVLRGHTPLKYYKKTRDVDVLLKAVCGSAAA